MTSTFRAVLHIWISSPIMSLKVASAPLLFLVRLRFFDPLFSSLIDLVDSRPKDRHQARLENGTVAKDEPCPPAAQLPAPSPASPRFLSTFPPPTAQARKERFDIAITELGVAGVYIHEREKQLSREK